MKKFISLLDNQVQLFLCDNPIPLPLVGMASSNNTHQHIIILYTYKAFIGEIFKILLMVTCYAQLQMGFHQKKKNNLVIKMTKHTKLVSDHLHCSNFFKNTHSSNVVLTNIAFNYYTNIHIHFMIQETHACSRLKDPCHYPL
jgi:hypothetical protein